MRESPLNPYSPPSDQPSVELPDSRPLARNIFLEVVQAVAEITGITIGWIFIGMDGAARWASGGTVLGFTIIALSCVIGLGLRSRRSRDNHDATVEGT